MFLYTLHIVLYYNLIVFLLDYLVATDPFSPTTELQTSLGDASNNNINISGVANNGQVSSNPWDMAGLEPAISQDLLGVDLGQVLLRYYRADKKKFPLYENVILICRLIPLLTEKVGRFLGSPCVY